jgi:hypothetical protein
MNKRMFTAFVAVLALTSMSAQSVKSSSKYGTVKKQSEVSYEDKAAYLEGRSNKTYTDLQVYNKDGNKAHHITLGLGAGCLFADGAKPYAKIMAAYETRHFVFSPFIGVALNELPEGATVNPGKEYMGLIAGGEVDFKALANEVYSMWLGLYGRVNAAWYRTDDPSADYSSSGSGTEFAAGIIGNLPVSSSLSLRLNAGVGSKIKVNHNETQWDNFGIHPDVQVSVIYHFNK